MILFLKIVIKTKMFFCFKKPIMFFKFKAPSPFEFQIFKSYKYLQAQKFVKIGSPTVNEKKSNLKCSNEQSKF
jgi:hypothetical protein